MAALSSNQLILTTARLGLLRLGVGRLGAIVQRAADMGAGGVYLWTRTYPSAGSWTIDKQ